MSYDVLPMFYRSLEASGFRSPQVLDQLDQSSAAHLRLTALIQPSHAKTLCKRACTQRGRKRRCAWSESEVNKSKQGRTKLPKLVWRTTFQEETSGFLFGFGL